MKIIPNLLLIAGTGTKSGKTSMACKIIEQFADLKIISIKISPHFHETTDGLISVIEDNGYAIYEETSAESTNDTSRMLNSGADKVYFSKVWDNQLFDVFNKIMNKIPVGYPVICESPALRYFVEPGLFIIITSEIDNKQKNINNLQILPHVMFKFEELKQIDKLPIGFKEGKWLLPISLH